MAEKSAEQFTRFVTSAIWSIFAGMNRPLSPKRPDELSIGQHVLACF